MIGEEAVDLLLLSVLLLVSLLSEEEWMLTSSKPVSICWEDSSAMSFEAFLLGDGFLLLDGVAVSSFSFSVLLRNTDSDSEPIVFFCNPFFY